jgi:tetratricopeptide (TPR) repeat protein
MSTTTPQCEKCRVERVFFRAAPFAGPQMYGVEWRCPKCDANALDICPVGPLVPTSQSCLNCGNPYETPGDNPTCASCGMTRQDVLDEFGLDPLPGDPVNAMDQLMKAGLIRRAIAIANLRLLADPQDAAAWRIKYSFLSQLGYVEPALAVLDAWYSNTNDSELLVSRGYALQSLNRHAEAADTYRKYLRDELHGHSADVALCNMANSLRELKDDANAERAYLEAIERNPTRATHYANFFRLLHTQKRYDQAHAIVDQGLSHATDPVITRILLEHKALLFAEQMKGDEALKYADMAIQRGANGVRARYLRGRALALLGELKEARREILHVLQLDPKNADGGRALAMIDNALSGS